MSSAPGIVSNCPSRWSDQPDDIRVTWAAPQRLNGVLQRYYVQLTTFDGRTDIASASIDENAALSVEFSNANLGKICKSCVAFVTFTSFSLLPVFQHLLFVERKIMQDN